MGPLFQRAQRQENRSPRPDRTESILRDGADILYVARVLYDPEWDFDQLDELRSGQRPGGVPGRGALYDAIAALDSL